MKGPKLLHSEVNGVIMPFHLVWLLKGGEIHVRSDSGRSTIHLEIYRMMISSDPDINVLFKG